MAAEITGYEIINGKKSKKYDYHKIVQQQSDVEFHRIKLSEEHEVKDGSIVCFHLKIPPHEWGSFHS